MALSNATVFDLKSMSWVMYVSTKSDHKNMGNGIQGWGGCYI